MAKKDIDLKPTEGMVKAAQRGLDLRDEYNRGGTDVGIARARDIVNRKNLSPSTVKRMYSFFSRHEGNKKAKGFRRGEEGYPSNGLIAWLLWGGDPGFSWSKKKRDQLERAEKNESAYYENKRLKDGNLVFTNKPALSLTDDELNEKIQKILDDMTDEDIEALGEEEAYELAREYAQTLIQINLTDEIKAFFSDLSDELEYRARMRTNDNTLINLAAQDDVFSGIMEKRTFRRDIIDIYFYLQNKDEDVPVDLEVYLHSNRMVIFMNHKEIEVVIEAFKVQDGNVVRWSEH